MHICLVHFSYFDSNLIMLSVSAPLALSLHVYIKIYVYAADSGDTNCKAFSFR